MRLTPIDIQQQQFRKTFRGVDRQEVQAFLDLVAQQLGEVTRENSELRADLRRSAREIEEHQGREATLREAMLTAQRAIEEIREQAQKEAQLVVSDAELRADRIVHHAHSRVTAILEEVADLKRQRVRALEELRGILRTHTKLIDLIDIKVANETEEASVTVLERLRPPPLPGADDSSRAETA